MLPRPTDTPTRTAVLDRSTASDVWKESTDPERDTKLDRIEHVLEHFPDRVFAFDEFGPLGIRPTGGSCWAGRGRPTGSLRPTTAPTST